MYKYTVEGLAEREAAEAAARDSSANTADPPTPPSATSSSDRAFWYNLKGIVVHSGTAFAGHYYSVIKVLTASCSRLGLFAECISESLLQLHFL